MNPNVIAKAVAVLSAAVFLSGQPAAQSNASPERFTAVAINMETPGHADANRVDIVVEKWSSTAGRDRLLAVLFEKGPEKLLDTLQELPRVGYFRTPNSIGYDIRFSQRTELADHGERVVLVTDRYINFWEARNQPRTVDYPFTVIELHIDGDGRGEGKMSIATKITGNKDSHTIVLENYATQPVMLNDVRREKA